MKKTISLALAGVLALSLLTGCQKTPETPAVIVKDQEQMLESAANGRENSALFAGLEVPERFTGEWTGLNGKLTVKADAEILLPDADKIPTGRVTARKFTQDDLDNFLRVFLKGQPYYEEVYITKQKAQEMLERFQAMQRGEIPLEGANYEDLPDLIEQYAEAARTAPDENDVRLAHTSFVDNGYFSEMNGWGTVDGKTVHLEVIQHEWSDRAAYYIPPYGNWNYSLVVPSNHVGGALPHDRIFPAFSEDEALRMGDALMVELGLNNVICDQLQPVFFYNEHYLNGGEDRGGWADMDPDELIEGTGYQLQYVRCVNGFPISYTREQGNAVEHEADHDAVWSYEQIEVCVTADGVVYFSWESPYNEPTVELEDTQLMSFPEITDIFQRMIMVKNSYQEAGNGTTYYVNRVHLGLMRIKAKDTRGEGLLVPVWDFWGTKDFPSDSGEYVDEQILLTINAIDGTVIDRSLGY